MAKQTINIGTTANDGTGDPLRTAMTKANDNFTELYASSGLTGRIICNQSNKDTTLGGVIDSTKQYFLDGAIDMGTTQITVPTTGISLLGLSFDISGLYSSEDNYTMFISESIAIGSGNLLGADYYVSVTGTNSKVYEIYDATGFNAFEFQRINYNDCTSLGDIYDYRQGLESGTGRFGGSPSLTLHGLWVGGYRITTSIVRSMSDVTTEPLFKAGTLFEMNSRFLTDINCDLGDLQPFCDFAPADFPNESTIQFKGVIMTRGGIANSNDTNITPNLSASDLSCDWDNNIGMNNTFIGGRAFVNSENLTNIVSGSTWYTLNAVWGSNNLQHFDSPSGGQLRHLGNDPREFKITVNFIIESTANNDVGIRLRRWDNSASSFVEFNERARQINSFVGGRDSGFYNFSFNTIMDKDDYVYFQVRNNTGNANVTLENGSDWVIEER